MENQIIRDVYYSIEDIEIKIFFPKGFNNSNLSVSLGEFDYDSENTCAIWRINKIEKENSNVKLMGNLLTNANSAISNISCILNLKCSIDKYSVSGGKVTKVTITKNPKNHNIYKGERSKTVVKSLEMIF